MPIPKLLGALQTQHPASARWFTGPLPTTRHVETLDILAADRAKRHLTIDVRLPARGRNSDQTWVLPLGYLSKVDPVAFLDFRDETGAVIALPPRRYSSEQTRSVLEGLLRPAATGALELATLHRAITVLVFADPPHSNEQGLEIVNGLLERSAFERNGWLDGILSRLVNNNVLWLPVSGRPGQTRVIKISYDIRLRRPTIPAQRPIARRLRLADTTTSTQ